MTLTPFHLALAVDDLEAARAFYRGVLGCHEGRSAPRWVDFDLYGHQLSLHLADSVAERVHNPVDGDSVPIPHFGVILRWDDWAALRVRLEEAGVGFIVGPRVRFEGQPGEQATMFFADPAGNMLEFKSFRDPARIFATGF
jgi:uncharacterized protein